MDDLYLADEDLGRQIRNDTKFPIYGTAPTPVVPQPPSKSELRSNQRFMSGYIPLRDPAEHGRRSVKRQTRSFQPSPMQQPTIVQEHSIPSRRGPANTYPDPLKIVHDNLPPMWLSWLIHPQDQCGVQTPEEYARKAFKQAFKQRDDKQNSLIPVQTLKFENSQFCKAFMSIKNAQETKEYVLTQVQRLDMRNVILFPPLLSRTAQNQVYDLSEDFVVVTTKCGAIVPVMEEESLEYYRQILVGMYCARPFSNVTPENMLSLVEK